MIKYLNPSYIFNLTGKILSLVKFFIIPIVIVGIIFSLFLSPEDYIQGHAVRIMYVHVPAAWISLLCFGTLSLLCIINFIFKIKSMSLVFKSLAPIGLTFNINSYWIYMGPTHMGNFLGMGRKANLYAYSLTFLYSFYFFL
tara:strand:- start:38 stop:460 length:423 start_codon:yes stop_codon:yes gene_type:complete